MHYYIDGYNCLFGVQGIHADLHVQRTKFIKKLRECVRMLHLSVTIVFDSKVQEESTRGSLAPLEYIYTNQYETADQYLINLVEQSRFPEKITIVTSDGPLASRVRAHGAHTIQVMPFVSWLTSRCAKVHKKALSPPAAGPFIRAEPLKKPAVVVKEEAKTCEDLCKVFEERYNKLCEEVDVVKVKRASPKAPSPGQAHPNLKVKKAKMKEKHPFLHPSESDTARWQRVFEREQDPASHPWEEPY